MAEIIDGKLVSSKIKEEIKLEIENMKKNGEQIPGLAVIIVGEDPASKVYVKNKQKDCEEVGMYSEEYALPESTTEQELLELVQKLNAKDDIHGILVQSPVPDHINENIIIENISPEKDVDAFHPENVGRITIGNYNFVPCTPAGVMELLKYYNIDPCGKECVVVGRSNTVGKPQALMLLQANGTVTVCHSKTIDLEKITKRADILIVAMRQRQFIKAGMVKEGAVVIDVGIHKKDDGKLCGDVDFAGVEKIASYITPVPGGVGPMTRTMLLKNTLTAAKNCRKL